MESCFFALLFAFSLIDLEILVCKLKLCGRYGLFLMYAASLGLFARSFGVDFFCSWLQVWLLEKFVTRAFYTSVFESFAEGFFVSCKFEWLSIGLISFRLFFKRGIGEAVIYELDLGLCRPFRTLFDC